MKKLPLLLLLAVSLFMGCKSVKKADNPFFSDYKTPFNVPPFDKIDSTHFMPAYLEGMKQHDEEINKIINDDQAATFENTILAFDKSGKLLTNVSKVSTR